MPARPPCRIKALTPVDPSLRRKSAIPDLRIKLSRRMNALYMYSARTTPMLALRLPPEIEKRLDALARETGRTKSFYAREAILRHLEDLEDAHLAAKRLREGGPRATLEELEAELDADECA